MKKMFILNGLMSFLVILTSNILFAAQTDVPLTANQWIKYSGSGTITNVFDAELNKDVLKITPAQGSSITAKYPASGSTNITQIFMSTKIKTTKTFSLQIYVLCSDNKYRWVYYEPGKIAITKSSSRVNVKVGEGLTNGQWQTIKSNVDADLFTMFGVHVNSIKQIRLSGDLSLGELKSIDNDSVLGLTIFSPEQNTTTSNMYIRMYSFLSPGLSAKYGKFMINGQIYPQTGGGKCLLVPLIKGINTLNITAYDYAENGPYNDKYRYVYTSLVVNCDPDLQDITFLAPNSWSITSGQGTVGVISNNDSMGYYATFVSNFEVNVASSNNSNLIVVSPTLDISIKEGLALKIKSSDYFYMYLLVKGTNGLNYYIYYQLTDGNTVVSSNKVYYKIGKKLLDNEWHTLVRDLDEDLFNGLGVHLDKVSKIYFYGKKFSFGNIRLLKRFQVPGEYSAIQGAIDTAIGGGLIKIAPGIYKGGILTKSGIILMGTNGHNITPDDESDDTIIDGTDFIGQYNVWGILNPDNPNIEKTVENQAVYGLVIQNCDKIGTSGGGSAIRCGWHSDSLSITDCLLRNNMGKSISAGDGSNVTSDFCVFEKNSISANNCFTNFISCRFINSCSFGLWAVSGLFKNCVFENNNLLYGSMFNETYLGTDFINCLFLNNQVKDYLIREWRISWNGWGPDIINCTFYGNSGTCIEFIEDKLVNGDAYIIIKNNIFCNNDKAISIVYDPDFPLALGSYLKIFNNNMYSNKINYTGSISDLNGLYGNISADPLFVTGPKGSYYLSQTAAGQAVNSPCVNTGGGTAAELGLDKYTTRSDGKADTGTVDMGYHYLMN